MTSETRLVSADLSGRFHFPLIIWLQGPPGSAKKAEPLRNTRKVVFMSLSNITLSSSVRQNLLSLQDTANLLSTTRDPPRHRQEGQQRARQPHQLLHRLRPRRPRQRHRQPARQHRQRRAGSAGCQHRHHLAVEAGRYRQVDRQPGAAAVLGLQHQGQRSFRRRGCRRGTTTAADINAGKVGGSVFAFTTAAGTAATITVGGTAVAYNATTKTATVKSLDDLNQALSAAGVNVTASITAAQELTFTSTNDGASREDHPNPDSLGPVGVVAANTLEISVLAAQSTAGTLVTAPTADAVSQTARSSLVAQYNQIIQQSHAPLRRTSSFDGVDLLNGDTLKLVFNETGESTSTIDRRDLQSERSRPEVAHQRHRLHR